MKAPLWLFFLLLILTSPNIPASTYAQTSPPTDSIRLQVRPASDSLIAIHQLFLRKRRSAKTAIWTGVGVGVGLGLIGLGSYALVNSAKKATSGMPLEEGSASISLKFSLPGLPILTLGVIRRIRFNRHREAVLVDAYKKGKGLPPSIRRSIRSQHFATQ
ncbi:hypothetical protein IC229_24405 [Spirosoma sp. BT702]|uniref:Uncharacterized protein n=1 Tax=Spirosoma profusum TaxID=2771354 RepID=A0A927ASG6_9BACT|nr:hypothetical protein [Spirosoma profusum]MBD2703811.1 hypothetical protein [Spirosoma profusum]